MKLILDHVYSYRGEFCIYEYYLDNRYHFRTIAKPNKYHIFHSLSIGLYTFLEYLGPKSDYPELFL